MATKSFMVNTEPHIAVIGNVELKFEPEIVGAEFVAAYAVLQEAQARLKKSRPVKASSTKHAKGEDDDLDPEALVGVSTAMREFVHTFLLPESQTVFETMRLPDRVLAQLLEWTSELYGGGSGNQAAAGGTSSG